MPFFGSDPQIVSPHPIPGAENGTVDLSQNPRSGPDVSGLGKNETRETRETKTHRFWTLSNRSIRKNMFSVQLAFHAFHFNQRHGQKDGISRIRIIRILLGGFVQRPKKKKEPCGISRTGWMHLELSQDFVVLLVY